jgi:Fe-Mn family superoxide dismutase
MIKEKFFNLPELPYDYKALEPYISKQQLEVHHGKHHLGYVNNFNEILKKMAKVRITSESLDMKSVLKSLAFNMNGHLLHSLFWRNLAPRGQGGQMSVQLQSLLKNSFGSIEQFKEEFSQTALSVEGSGWAALVYNKEMDLSLVMQIEKHNVNIYLGFTILLVLDVWEHAYYLDYVNSKKDFIDNFWNIVNWNEIDKRLTEC